ncbi:MAG: hypothetical protein OEW37_06580 [Rhodospirillaceae bacterium]|nr:hypothetical protein [Rhodospirillaceae bacterium]
MAQIARSFTSLNQNVPSGHAASGGRNVASVARSPIDEISAKAGVQAEESFVFQDFTDQGFRKRKRSQPIKNTSSLFESPSSSFAHLLNQDQVDSEKSKTPQYGTASFRNILSKAISAYEGTAKVISGATSPRGTSFSLSL